MIETIKVKLQPFNAEAFKPYGQMLESKRPIFPEVEPGEGRIALELRHIKARPEGKRTDQMAVHFSYSQIFIPVHGTLVLIVAPAPRNKEADPEQYEFDYGRVAAFVLEPGQAAFVDKGVWHNSFMIGPQCTYINVTRKNPGEGTGVDALGRVDRIHKRRPYVEFVDLLKRDNRVIELELGSFKELVDG